VIPAIIQGTSISQAATIGALQAHKHGTRTIILQDNLRPWLKALPKIGNRAVSDAEADP
jgi:hypothetical protein